MKIEAKCTKCENYVEFFTKSKVVSGQIVDGPVCIMCGHEQCKVD